MQVLFQNGYDTLVALLQALPQCINAYNPAAMIPETSVTLFHIHNLLLQAAFVSHQEFDVWTELMQAGLGLYLLRAPRRSVVFTNAQLDCVLDAMAHQDLWKFQGLIWQRMLPSIPEWDSLQDFTSIVETCELQAQAAATAASAAAEEAAASFEAPIAAASAAAPSPLPTPLWPPPQSDAACTRFMLPSMPRPSSNDPELPPWAGLAVPSGMVAFPSAPSSPFSSSSPSSHQPLAAHIHHHHDEPPIVGSHPITGAWEAPPPAPLVLASAAAMAAAAELPPPPLAAALLYNSKVDELETYSSLMAECIRVAMEGAAVRGLAAAPQPEVAAAQLVELAAGFEARQRSAIGPLALRYSFTPGPEWLSQVAAAAIGSADNMSAAQVLKLLSDLEALAPKPVECHGAAHRWLEAPGQGVVERAVRDHSASGAWSTRETVSVVKALVGKCTSPPGAAMCSLLEGLLLGSEEAKDDMDLLCDLLQDAVDFATLEGSGSSRGREEGGPQQRPASAELSPAHLSLVRVALNRAIYLVGSYAAGTTAASSSSGGSGGSSVASTSGSGSSLASADGAYSGRSRPQRWADRDFLFDRYPRLLRAARSFDYPLQSFRLQEYAEELYDHLATAPGRELVAVGPEGLTRMLGAVASTPCCQDPQWAAAFERACLTMLDVQFSVGYTHPKRWLGLLDATVAALPFPMPALAAAIKALMVRLCDTRRYASYFWELLPLVGALERRAAAGGSCAASRQQSHEGSSSPGQPFWMPGGLGGGRSGHGGRGSTRRGASSGSSSPGGAAASGGAGPAGTVTPASGHRPMVPPPDLSRHLVGEEEYSRWCEELGQRLALSMAALSDQDRVAQLSVYGIGSRA
ncbi:hypothetical protein GPECTOR_11g30 [Gonium pectorale]|uniref:Uncharacterized protein n=1 Tax=Gonium pectorale TaxID=33097 RepID=A0A150GPZ4_GONPE|nr:hypothetical protein GPECTOR_11g30 [Gonium pectorale]|eukprot:KXZ51863.1 hypothetical protein GPECTOR_11g30 [Gonium pectorale]